MATKKTTSCPDCGAPLREDVRRVTYEYKGKECALDQPGLWCTSCEEEGVLNPEHLRSTRKALHDFHARVDGLLSSDEVRAIRKKLRLSQHRAAALFGGGPNAFSRYERGEIMQSRATDNLLRLLARAPEQMAYLNTGSEGAFRREDYARVSD